MNITIHIKSVSDSIPTLPGHTLKILVYGKIGIRQNYIPQTISWVVSQQIIVITICLSYLSQVKGRHRQFVGTHSIKCMTAAQYQGIDRT